MKIRESSYGYWSSNRTFLWVAAGTTIGIGNVARLPYFMGEYGGVVFLAAYLLALFVIALPLLVSEWSLGRWMRDDLIQGFGKLAQAARAPRAWAWVGGLALAGAVMILSYYSVIAGWSIAYALRSTTGLLGGMSEEQAHAAFLQLAQDPERGLSWHTIFMVIACIIVAHGFREGLERAALRLVPTAFLLAILLCIYALVRGDTLAAANYMLAPDLGRFGWRGAMEALHQAFFTLSLGFGAMVGLGSYLPAQAPLARLGAGVVLMDTLFAMLSGLAVLALTFSAGLQPAGGLTLLFQVFPRALPQGVEGAIIGCAFFCMLFLVTMTSAAALLEPVTRYMMDRWRWTRVFAAACSALMIWYLGLGTLLSFSVIQNLVLFGRNFFEWVQWLTASWIAPGCALLICVFVSRIMPPEFTQAAYGDRDRWLYRSWLWLLRYPARVGLIAVLLYAAGFIGWITDLWS